jgi:hypothetical protein
MAASVFGDAPPKELDGLGEKSRLGIVRPVEVSHADGCTEFSRDAVGFRVIIT